MAISPTSTSPRSWFEADHSRLVMEVEAVQLRFPNFDWFIEDERLCCEGDVFAEFPESETGRLRIRVSYPYGFPAAPIRVVPMSGQISANLWGHEWHRWDDGSLCLGDPNHWDITYTGRDVIEKAEEWYFNFLAKVLGKIEKMPDVGRAILLEQGTTEQEMNRMRQQEGS